MIYADSTFLLALKVPADKFHLRSLRFFESRQDEVWLWSPWHRIEVFNSIRQLTRCARREGRLLPPEARASINLIEEDVRVGYFTHMEADWRDVLRTANEISIAHAFDLPCRAADLLHVAYAKELSSRLFVSYDDDQLEVARAAGLKTCRPD